MAVILIVDDDDSTCRPLVRLFAVLGHRGICIPNGHAALAHLKNKHADLILLDVMMPDMEGTEVLRILRSKPTTAKLPVIMYSAVSDAAFQAHTIALGANEYWVKASIDFREIEQRVARFLETGTNV